MKIQIDMKNYLKLSLYAFLLGAALILASCQDEDPLEESFDPEQTLTTDAEGLTLIKKVVANDGSGDNIIDGASCFDIAFPYSVVVNDSEIMVETSADLLLVEESLDVLEDEDYDFQLNFPLTVTMADYTEVTVDSYDSLYELADTCVEGGEDDDIECVDIVYPVTVFTYNPNFQLTNTIEVENDFQFRRFFAGLAEQDLMGLNFPVSFQYKDSTQVTVNSNSELTDIIRKSQTQCDEDDDNDHNDDDFTEERLDETLVKCPWSIGRLVRNEQDDSGQYENYYLTFLEDGKVTASNSFGFKMEGEWQTRISDYRVVVDLEFEDSAEFNGTWYVYEIVEGIINLFNENKDKITLEKACDYKPIECSDEYISEYLKECPYKILNEDGTFFEELTIDFDSELVMYVKNPNGTVVDEGRWSISGNVVVFEGLSMTLANYIGEWQVIECGEGRFKLKRNTEVILLVMQCED
ncbi:hypothetical protein D1013_16990 [Euzebyella marina]|uniref:Lipocalin-like domain-containing protein n=2 Tax=Euzebyella marina TaxID=1761453 RepID=A0A3G2L9P4_9FLAO|nr:hypothetical protein D1013_16990 [Euzebyella marina]